MKTIQYQLEGGIATITFDEQGSPVNTMCRDWQEDLTAVTARVVKDRDTIHGIIVSCPSSIVALPRHPPPLPLPLKTTR